MQGNKYQVVVIIGDILENYLPCISSSLKMSTYYEHYIGLVKYSYLSPSQYI